MPKVTHIWLQRESDYKCLLCGGIVKKLPGLKDYDFVPRQYELPLTEEERDEAARARKFKRMV